MDHLTLLDDLFPQIRHNNLKLALMVPRVVINELDNLKTNGASQEKRAKAQNANRWLAMQMQPGQRCLRGQKSTRAPGGRHSVSAWGGRWFGVARLLTE
jgi:PIN domain